MKTKLHLTITMLLLVALTMAAQPKEHKQRACDVVKTVMKNGKIVTTLDQQVTENAPENLQQGHFSYYNPQQSPRLAEDESTDSATVTLLYENFSEEDYAIHMVRTIMMYNNDWSAQWRPGRYLPDGSPVAGIIVRIPYGTFDIYSATINTNNGADYVQIKELVKIDKDTTIYLDVLNCPNLFSYELRNVNNELLHPTIVRPINEEPWEEVVEEGNMNGSNGRAFLMLKDYGNVLNMEFYADNGITVEGHGKTTYGLSYFNDLSDRYQYVVVDNTEGKDGILYVNRLITDASNGFPLSNNINDYVSYEEKIQGTPKGLEIVENPCVGLFVMTFIDNSFEYSNTLPGHTPIGEDRIAKVMINANKNEGEYLTGINCAVSLSVIDYEKWIIDEEFGFSTHDYAITVGPKVMINRDQSLNFLVISDVAQTPEVGVWKDDYPPHPKFSYSGEQKKDVVGNCCPLLAINSGNKWSRTANQIVMSNQHIGRYGEIFGSGDIYSTMTAKYNNEEIYSGKQALDSLRLAWWRNQPDGVYELEFTNANVAVDGIEGKNVTTVYFDQTKEDQNPPVLKMLQFRDSENNVTDRFIVPNEGTIMIAGGDFDPRSTTYINDNGYEQTWNYEECKPMTVEVSYAPYGTDEWQVLEGMEHQSEFDDIPGMGFFYSGSLASVNVPSENKWYDLKFRLVDESGNWQEQTLSPAFKIESLTPDAVTEVYNSDTTEVARYSVDGRLITTPEPGINIVVMSDGTAHKVSVK